MLNMDRFKFRAFYKGEMWNVCGVIGEFENLVLRKNNQYEIGTEAPTSQVSLMQCTGLKDKNGTLIYEGDIVEYEVINEEVVVVGEIYFMSVYSGFYVVNNRDYVYEHLDMLRAENCEIVGNIYENSELLRSKNEFK